MLVRFAFLFWGSFCLSAGVVMLLFWWAPWVDRWVLHWPLLLVTWPQEKFAAWLAAHVFHLVGEAATRHPTGSGDTALDWIDALSSLTFALVGTLLWTTIAELRRRRTEYRTLYTWLLLAVRFMLASALLGYGFSKVFPLQFSVPGSYILHETYGNSSPMALLWTFMGASPAYTIFGGLAEVIPGLLLLFRRTATLGALGASAVLLNVVLLNFCYDVPVKLYSTTLLCAALFLLLPEAGPLWRFLVLRRAASPSEVYLPPWQRRAMRYTAWAVQAILIAHMLFITAVSSYRQWHAQHHPGTTHEQGQADPPNIDGLWIVDKRSGWPANEQWQTVTIGSLRYASVDYFQVVQADGKPWFYSETTNHSRMIRFLSRDARLQWTLLQPDKAVLEGQWLGQPVSLSMHRNQGTYPLLSRGFHWVQEMPYNR